MTWLHHASELARETRATSLGLDPRGHGDQGPSRKQATAGLYLVARLGGRPLFTFVIVRVLRRFPAYTGRHMARLAARFTVDDVPTFRTTAYRYTSRAQRPERYTSTREPM